jgi:hypothetical protein
LLPKGTAEGTPVHQLLQPRATPAGQDQRQRIVGQAADETLASLDICHETLHLLTGICKPPIILLNHDISQRQAIHLHYADTSKH